MKKFVLFSALLFLAPSAHGQGWTQYTMNNILSMCMKKSQQNPPAKVTSPDYGCGCFVKTISAQIAFEDMRKKEHTKYDQYLVDQANHQCNSNYSF